MIHLQHNARLRGWQRMTTKLKHKNRNHRGSLGLETLRLTVPLEAFVKCTFLIKNSSLKEQSVP
ncbi:hypothetical protein CGT74_17880 [Vibrio cholerae]|nr:hypothetical protein CGT74_17880 [Vibrio cholerae]